MYRRDGDRGGLGPPPLFSNTSMSHVFSSKENDHKLVAVQIQSQWKPIGDPREAKKMALVRSTAWGGGSSDK